MIDGWPDEGLKHPPLKNVRTIRVRLNPIGPLPPRIVLDDIWDELCGEDADEWENEDAADVLGEGI